MPGRLRILRGARSQRGASAVEFALVAPVFFLLLFSIVDFGAMMWANLTMQHAVREGARYAVTGQTGLDASQSPARYRAVLEKIQDSSLGVYDMSQAKVTTWVNGSSTPNGAGMFGNAGDIIVIQVTCDWPLMTPLVAAYFKANGGKYHFSVAATMRNEAF
ncbi:TadE/TadG family type IV pilus assembly protein [Cupriavidus pauculus]|uniref:TadE/TadG family type IV pilus assembly protein n=1 Tax=Cupriavidus pauculus TaxID=82633 RepID=UPI001EE374D3|nr:TadE/TadG family type IV pilus assembly protein [Cupriavidus pauculus]GJG93707.1 pilus assembly protein [Cupriavidus pauculus]